MAFKLYTLMSSISFITSYVDPPLLLLALDFIPGNNDGE